jgi:hypothetical protein
VSVVEAIPGADLAGIVRDLVGRGGGTLLAPGQRPPGDDWLRLSDVVDDPTVLPDWVRTAVSRHGGPDVAASYLVIWLAWPLARLLLGPVLTGGRALVAGPSAIWVRRHPRGWVMGTAVEAPGLLVAAGDALAAGGAGLPAGRLDVAPLAADVRAAALHGLVVALSPVVAALRGLSRRGGHALWGGVVDACARLAVDAAGGAATRDEAEAAIEALLGAADPPLRARPRVLSVPHGGGVATALSFSVCCFGDKDPARGFALCAGCPKLTEADMVDRLRACLPRSA